MSGLFFLRVAVWTPFSGTNFGVFFSVWSWLVAFLVVFCLGFCLMFGRFAPETVRKNSLNVRASVSRKVFGHELRQLWWCGFGWFLAGVLFGILHISGRHFSPLSGLPFLFGLSLLLSLPLLPSSLGVGPCPFLFSSCSACRTRRPWKAGRCCTRFASFFLSCLLSFSFCLGRLPSPSLLFLFLSLSLALHQSV